MKRHFYKLRKLILGKPDLRDDYYSNLISQFNKPDSYNLLVKKCSKNHINTNVEINFSDVLKFNCSIKQFKKTISYKCYYEKQNKTLNTRILFYKLEMGDHKVKCQVHFHNGELFYFIYTFPYLNNENKHEIIKILSTKYLPEMTN